MQTQYDVHQLAYEGNANFVELLAGNLIEPGVLNTQEQPPIYSALVLPSHYESNLKHQKEKIFQALFELNPKIIHHRDKSGETVLHYLARFGYDNLLQHIIRTHPQELAAFFIASHRGTYPIHEAILNGHEDVLAHLLPIAIKDAVGKMSHKMSLITDNDNRSLIHYAAWHGSADMVKKCCEALSKSEILQNIHREDGNGKTPSELALSYNTRNDVSAIQDVLVDYGAPRQSRLDLSL